MTLDERLYDGELGMWLPNLQVTDLDGPRQPLASACKACIRTSAAGGSGYWSSSKGTPLPLNHIEVRACSILTKPICSPDLTCPVRAPSLCR